MRVFVTGATGWIGSGVVRELLDAGHQVLGLARSDGGAAALKAAGAEVHRGDLNDLDSLRTGAAASDGVIHTAYDHAFTDYAAAAALDRQAIGALGEALAGSNRPLIITEGVQRNAPGQMGTEDSVPPLGSFGRPRFESEEGAVAFVERGVRVAVVRFPPTVHGRGDHGFVSILISIARTKGVSAYPGDGSNRWAAVHRLDAAHLHCLALQSAPAAARLNGVAEEGVPVRQIAEVIGRHLDVPVTSISPEKATDHFGFIGILLAQDLPASSAKTRKLLGWQPVQAGLIQDLEEGHYFEKLPERNARMAASAWNPNR
jgi:nucleoside-diphosphate-sugar epimerase